MYRKILHSLQNYLFVKRKVYFVIRTFHHNAQEPVGHKEDI
jgi:hypothetical protein